MLNMTEIPQVFADLLNIPENTAGVLLSIILVAAVVVFLSIVKAKEIAIAGVTVGMFSLFTFLTWFPIWVTILVALVVAVLFGKEASTIIRGGG